MMTTHTTTATEKSGYTNISGEFVSFEDAHKRMSELEDVAGGVLMFCDAILDKSKSLTPEEGAELALIRLAAKELAIGISSITPEARP